MGLDRLAAGLVMRATSMSPLAASWDSRAVQLAFCNFIANLRNGEYRKSWDEDTRAEFDRVVRGIKFPGPITKDRGLLSDFVGSMDFLGRRIEIALRIEVGSAVIQWPWKPGLLARSHSILARTPHRRSS